MYVSPPTQNSARPGRPKWRTLIDEFATYLTAVPPWVVLVQLFIGLGWLRAAAEKAIDAQWWNGTVINDFLSAHEGATLGWYQPFVDSVVAPAAPLVAVVVLLGQLVAGVSLTSGRRVGVGLAVGIFLNAHFMSAGAVTPSAFYLLAQGAIVLWMSERSHARRWTQGLLVTATAAAFVAAMNVPFISTLHPHEVIEDPAIMFVLAGSLTTLSCLLAMHARSVAGQNHAEQQRADQPHAVRLPDSSWAEAGDSVEERGAFSAQLG